MEGISLTIRGTLTKPLEDIQHELPRAEKRALYRSAYFLRDKIKESLISSIPKATQPNPKYNDVLTDAVGFSKVDGASINVNAMGTNRPGSGAYRARFFEEGTKDRYQKKYNGEKRKKKKFIGHIGATHFFNDAVEANRSQVVSIMQDVLSEYVKQAFEYKNI